eukprot:360156-Chlamydomonas_euryale.AAC.2
MPLSNHPVSNSGAMRWATPCVHCPSRCADRCESTRTKHPCPRLRSARGEVLRSSNPYASQNFCGVA